MSEIITCVIPSLNQGFFIEEAIKSVVSQNCFEKVDLIVIDGCSSDETLNVLDRYVQHFHTLISEKDKGQAAAINKGVALGSGKYVCWLNSDDLLLPGAMHQQVKFLEKHENIKAVHGIGINVAEDGSYISDYPSGPVSKKTMARGCPISQPTSMILKETWEKVGGLNEDLQMCMDYDLWWRVLKETEIGFIPHKLACNRVHGATKTATLRQTHYRESFKVLKRELGYIPIKWMVDGLFESTVGRYPRQATNWQRFVALTKFPKYYWNNCK